MKRAAANLTLFASLSLLAACGSGGGDPEAQDTSVPEAIAGIGATDCKFFRYKGVPSFVYGPSPETMSMADEHVPIDDFIHVLRTHALAAFDYLTTADELVDRI